jgi:succinate dehydrogenase/fumarate reductase flavoprotein subunit
VRAGSTSVEHEMSEIMWRMCGVIKNSDTMSTAYEELERLEEEASRMGACKMSGLRDVIEVVFMVK